MDPYRRSPPQSPRRDGRRFEGGSGGPPDRRRQRSVSPRGYRRSPPQKRFRRDDGDGYDRHGGARYDNRRGSGRGGRFDDLRRREPMTFREFIGTLPDDITPEAANVEFKRYLSAWWGDSIKAEFEQKKTDPTLRRKFDPREVAVFVQRRNELAQKAAESFVDGAESALESDTPPGPAGLVDHHTADAAAVPQEEKADVTMEDQQQKVAPVLSTTADQVKEDLLLARTLVRKLDSEKGIAGNPLGLPEAPPPKEEEQEQNEDAGKDDKTETDKAAEGNEEAALAEDKKVENAENGDTKEQGNEPTTNEKPATEKKEVAPVVAITILPVDEEQVAEMSEEDRVTALDRLIAYLWLVHGIDYYTGKEFNNSIDEDAAGRVSAKRTTRPEAPEALPEGEEAEKAKKEYDETITGVWKARVAKGDALENLLQREKVARLVDDFIDSQIIKINDTKWGNRLSTKLFVDRKFVVKHIQNKHTAVLDAERDRILDDIYFENYRAVKSLEPRKEEDQWESGHYGGGGGGGRGRGRGRGGGGHFRGGMLPEGTLMVDPTMLNGPIIMPGAAGMAPMLMAPMVMGGPMGRGGGRGGRGGGRGMMRGGMMGGFGGTPPVMMGGGPQQKGYYDLDAPQNNRAVLDYGDL